MSDKARSPGALTSQCRMQELILFSHIKFVVMLIVLHFLLEDICDQHQQQEVPSATKVECMP